MGLDAIDVRKQISANLTMFSLFKRPLGLFGEGI